MMDIAFVYIPERDEEYRHRIIDTLDMMGITIFNSRKYDCKYNRR